jgi:RNA polymerase sigma-70 factor (ECF subfamily)
MEMSVVDEAVAEERFRRIYAAYDRHIYAYCLRRIDRDQAIDCTADTFLIAWRRISDVPDGDKALPWLYRTAHHVIGDRYRHRARSRTLVEALRANPTTGHGDLPETVVVRREADTAVLDALQRLRPADQEVLRLAVWEELSHAEIGELFGCSAHAVDQRIHRAAKRLGRELHATAKTASHTMLRFDASGGE